MLKKFGVEIFIICCFAFTSIGAAMASDYQDWWWNSSLNGMGVNVGQQGNTVFAAWYMYDSDGSASFLTLSGPISGGVVSGNLYRTTGPLPGPGYNPNLVDAVAVGTGKITFTSNTTAVLNYNYDGRSGSINLERFTFGAYAIDGDFAVTTTFIRSGCQNAALHLTTYDGHLATITGDSTALSIDQWDPPCTALVELTQSGSVFEGSGPWSCVIGSGGTFTFSELNLSEDRFIGRFTQEWTKGETCFEEGIIAGLKIP